MGVSPTGEKWERIRGNPQVVAFPGISPYFSPGGGIPGDNFIFKNSFIDAL